MQKSRFRLIVENAIREAKQVGLLYHATDLDNVLNILKDNSLHAVRDIGISTSRNLHIFLHGYYSDCEACLVLDGNKISEHYRVLPFRYPLAGDTSETVIVTNKDLDDEKYKYPVSTIGKYHNWLKHFEDENDPNYDAWGGEHEYVGAGSTLYNLDKYLVKILIKRSAIEITNKTEHSEQIKKNQKLFNEIKDLAYIPVEIVNDLPSSVKEDTVKQGNSWVNKGKEGTHGKFKSKKAADKQRKAMFANGYKG